MKQTTPPPLASWAQILYIVRCSLITLAIGLTGMYISWNVISHSLLSNDVAVILTVGVLFLSMAPILLGMFTISLVGVYALIQCVEQETFHPFRNHQPSTIPPSLST